MSRSPARCNCNSTPGPPTSTRRTCKLPAGPYIRFSATAVTLTVAGQTLSGDVTVTKTATSRADHRRQRLALARGRARDAHPGQRARSRSTPAGLYGTFAGTVVLNVPAVSFAAQLTADIDTRAATRHVKLTGTNVALSIAGATLTGDFTLEQSAAGVKVTIKSHAGSSLLTLGSFVNVRQASGEFTIAPTGVTGSVTITDVVVTLPGIGFTLAPGGSISLALTSSSVSVSVIGAKLTLASGPALQGNFVFDQQAGLTRIAATDVVRRRHRRRQRRDAERGRGRVRRSPRPASPATCPGGERRRRADRRRRRSCCCGSTRPARRRPDDRRSAPRSVHIKFAAGEENALRRLDLRT